MVNQQIQCSVNSCRYNDKSKYCTLNDIVVGSSKGEASNAQDTECDSFEKM